MSILNLNIESKSQLNLEVNDGVSLELSLPRKLTLNLDGPFVGIDGKSAYQIAVDNGFVGTEAEWLASLQGGGAIEVNFAYNNATPSLLTLAHAGKAITRIQLNIVVPFDGLGASLEVGTIATPDELMKTYENDVTEVGSNETSPAKRYNTDTQLYLTINPGSSASQGSGVAMIYIQR